MLGWRRSRRSASSSASPPRNDDDKDQIGIVTGLAWTDVGGELLTIEAAMMPGKGRMTVTGNLRDVMRESISHSTDCRLLRRNPF
jgi:ATP-dependent Lon protease